MRFKGVMAQWSVAHWFNIVGLLVMILGTFVIGNWLTRQIAKSIINESAANTALYLDSFITPNLQELATSNAISPEKAGIIESLLTETKIGREIAVIKVWDKNGKLLYSNNANLVGQVFEPAEDLRLAWQGQIVSQISNLDEAENVEESANFDRLLEIYVPVRLKDSHQVIAVAEFYVIVTGLDQQIFVAQRESWLAVGVSMGVIYLLLMLFFQMARHRIRQQGIALKNQVAQLTEVVSYNAELDRRVLQASANAVTLNEIILHRIETELADGTVKELEFSLRLLQEAITQNNFCHLANQDNSKCNQNLPVVQASIQNSLQEMSNIAHGLGLPQLEGFSLHEAVLDVVQKHERNTGTSVRLTVGQIPRRVPLSVQITIYRVVQEALTNSYRHAGGLGQVVSLDCDHEVLVVQVSDQGSGFPVGQLKHMDGHLGLAGMRERIESLGGTLVLESEPNRGTKISARLRLKQLEETIKPSMATLEQ